MAAEDKRTWREPKAQVQSEKLEPAWTAMDVLIAYAGAKGWVTAKAGRPDINRAGNAGVYIFQSHKRQTMTFQNSSPRIGRG